MEVADAEAEAALEAVKAACEHATPGTTSLWLCIDNRSVVDGINVTSDKIGTSQPTIDEIRGKLSGWQHQGNGQAMWVPGHTSVQGNERADRLAKEGAGLEQACDTRWMTLARAKRWRKEWLTYRLDNWWNQQRKPGHFKKQLEVPKPWNHKLYRGLNRVNVGRVLAARSAHGDFADYHERFAHETELTCQCGKRKSPLHVWACSKRSFRLIVSENFVAKLLPTNTGLA
jgi:hypothetical protein